MSWFDRKFFTLEEVLNLPCDANKEKIADMQRIALTHAINDVTQFSIGDRVELPFGTGEEGDNTTVKFVPAVVVGVHFTASQVSYDLAIPIDGCDLFMVFNNFRGDMRTIDGSNATDFIEKRVAEALVKKTLGTPNLKVIENE